MRVFSSHSRKCSPKRCGVTAVLIAVLIVPLLAMVAFAIDYGYLTVQRSEMQRAADAAALAAVQDLLPDPDGTQHLFRTRRRVREYTNDNIGSITQVTYDGSTYNKYGFTVLDNDIQIGRYDTTTIYSGNVNLLNTGVFDTVRVTLRHDGSANGPLPLFFANALGFSSQNMQVTATAVLRRAQGLPALGDILPFALHQSTWTNTQQGNTLTLYSNSVVDNSTGTTVPGDWGTVDIGPFNDSANDLSYQILNGLRQSDLDALYAEGRITTSEYLEASPKAPVWVNADAGLNVNIRTAIEAVTGMTRIIPIYRTLSRVDASTGTTTTNTTGDLSAVGGGDTVNFEVVGWGVVKVTGSSSVC